MYLHFNLKSIRCLRAHDAFNHIARNRYPEFYFTWRAYLRDADNRPIALHQGFSDGCGIEDGHHVAPGQAIQLTDTRATIVLPELAAGECRLITFDVFCWESDRTSAEIKALFTNAAHRELWAIHQQRLEDRKGARKAARRFLTKSAQTIASAYTASVASMVNFETVSGFAFDLTSELLARIVKTLGADDYIGVHHTDLMYKRDAGGYRYRWILDHGPEIWQDEAGEPIYISPRFREDRAHNLVVGNGFFNVIFDD